LLDLDKSSGLTPTQLLGEEEIVTHKGANRLGMCVEDVWIGQVAHLKDRLGDQRGGSEWEPIKILHRGD
jgi:hypothetical protein